MTEEELYERHGDFLREHCGEEEAVLRMIRRRERMLESELKARAALRGALWPDGEIDHDRLAKLEARERDREAFERAFAEGLARRGAMRGFAGARDD